MTPFYLQRDLKKELEILFKDFKLKSPCGEYSVLKVF